MGVPNLCPNVPKSLRTCRRHDLPNRIAKPRQDTSRHPTPPPPGRSGRGLQRLRLRQLHWPWPAWLTKSPRAKQPRSELVNDTSTTAKAKSSSSRYQLATTSSGYVRTKNGLLAEVGVETSAMPRVQPGHAVASSRSSSQHRSRRVRQVSLIPSRPPLSTRAATTGRPTQAAHLATATT